MDISDRHPCADEPCAAFITESDDPFVCFHRHNHSEAIKYWGKVLQGELTPDDVIDSYREFLDFDEAATTEKQDHFDEDMNWTGPTVDIEVRVNNETVKTITAHPLDGFDTMGYDTALTYAYGYGDALFEQSKDE